MNYYDFNQEKRIIKVCGGYLILKKPLTHRVFNSLLIIFVLVLYMIIAYYGILTTIVMIKTGQNVAATKSLYIAMIVVIAFFLSLSKITAIDELKQSIEILKVGVYTYKSLQDEILKIKSERLRKMKFLIHTLIIGLYTSASTEVIIGPFFRYILDQKSSSELIDPYLPFPLIMPFDTHNLLGYITASLLHLLTMFFIYSSCTSGVELFLSCVIQLITEYEILIYSLKNIERRALTELGKSPSYSQTIEQLYDSVEFQKAVYMCLRENIQHHHAIIKLKTLFATFLSAMNLTVIASCSVVVGCAILALLEDPKSLSSMITCVCSFFPMCYLGQLVINVTEELWTTIYSMPWMFFSKETKILVKIMLNYARSAVVIRTKFCGITINLETFSDVFSAGYKLTSVLRSI